MKRIVLCLVLSLSCAVVHAEIKLPAIFGNNMVLQQKIACPVWGTTDAGENVSVAIAGQTKTAKADADGKWAVKLDPLEVGEPLKMTITDSKNAIVFDNSLVGEVWIGSGQSNMQWNVNNSHNGGNEAKTADFPNLRLLTVPTVSKTTPQDNFEGSWVPCTPQNVPGFSAVLFFFGRKLHQDLNVPVGLIHCSWGGSSCESWINDDVVAKNPDFAQILERRTNREKEQPQGGDNQQAGYLYNGMLHPILGYGIRGVVWYQGETNAGRAYQYRTLFPTMIYNWRDEWKQGDFPFYWVQLANFMAMQDNPRDSAWAELREAQSMTRSLPKSGQAVIIDIGEADDIHPRNKRDVGLRLALLALNNDYGKTQPCESPQFNAVSFVGDKATLTFDFAYDGLVSRGAAPTGFAVAGEDKVFHWATAEIVGKDTVVVRSPKVAKPVAVRYGWADNPIVTMYNSAKLPMNPFRTDDWQGVTVNSR
jgi:sialate O-acetylesterase